MSEQPSVEIAHTCCACFTHNNMPCCNAGHQPDRIGARTVQQAWDRSPLLTSVKAAREESGAVSNARHRFNNDLRYRVDDHEMQRQLTPSYVLEPVREALGGIGLDPCTEPDNPCGAERFYTAATDGAEEAWDADTIYVNPPYSKARERWVARCIEAAEVGCRVILLMPSHTDTRLFHRAVDTASHVVFIKGRVKFGILRDNGRQEAASHPSCLICWNLPDPSPLAHLGRVWDLTLPPAPPCRQCGPGYRIGDDGCRHSGVDYPPGHDGHAQQLNGLLADCPGCAAVVLPPSQSCRHAWLGDGSEYRCERCGALSSSPAGGESDG